MDKLTEEQRHRCMAAIRSKNTRPEILVRRFLFAYGFRFRIHHPRLPGHPDIVLPKYRTVIFVNGCFWHGHEDCRYFVMPKSNVAFWTNKIERNRQRDGRVQRQLAAMGWHCIVIWECQLKKKVREATLTSLVYTLDHIYLEDRRLRPLPIPAAAPQPSIPTYPISPSAVPVAPSVAPYTFPEPARETATAAEPTATYSKTKGPKPLPSPEDSFRCAAPALSSDACTTSAEHPASADTDALADLNPDSKSSSH